ncbi:hypothetical protein Acr_00g0003360 [Actinidia rufa]|uniref:Uncharacterized protein n=1 Tax=Actinidia rufa TaxID=165716 RepID=A0A7J0D738_9ERIC|nr:hypothetical protein Acr_00g0003360 [Actinidia rufa]
MVSSISSLFGFTYNTSSDTFPLIQSQRVARILSSFRVGWIPGSWLSLKGKEGEAHSIAVSGPNGRGQAHQLAALEPAALYPSREAVELLRSSSLPGKGSESSELISSHLTLEGNT